MPIGYIVKSHELIYRGQFVQIGRDPLFQILAPILQHCICYIISEHPSVFFAVEMGGDDISIQADLVKQIEQDLSSILFPHTSVPAYMVDHRDTTAYVCLNFEEGVKAFATKQCLIHFCLSLVVSTTYEQFGNLFVSIEDEEEVMARFVQICRRRRGNFPRST
jgi:hypothetical protein